MPYQQIKSNQLYWLKMIDVDHYCSSSHKVIAGIKNQYEALNNSQPKNSYPEKVATKQNISSLMQSKEELIKTTTIFEVNEMHDDVTETRILADQATSLTELKETILKYEGCSIKGFSKNTVFGDGNPNAQLMFIGEAPGVNEDLTGKPFCGDSGKLLDSMLAAIKVSRASNAYITNTVFWRPPANRPPTQQEIDLCRPFVEKHIALIKPKLIILVGSTAATSLLGKHAGITKIRQEYFSYTNKYLDKPIPLTAIFHPAYLLRQPMQKKTSWYDLLKIQQYIEEQKII